MALYRCTYYLSDTPADHVDGPTALACCVGFVHSAVERHLHYLLGESRCDRHGDRPVPPADPTPPSRLLCLRRGQQRRNPHGQGKLTVLSLSTWSG